jgi:hypothetical protein
MKYPPAAQLTAEAHDTEATSACPPVFRAARPGTLTARPHTPAAGAPGAADTAPPPAGLAGTPGRTTAGLRTTAFRASGADRAANNQDQARSTMTVTKTTSQTAAAAQLAGACHHLDAERRPAVDVRHSRGRLSLDLHATALTAGRWQQPDRPAPGAPSGWLPEHLRPTAQDHAAAKQAPPTFAARGIQAADRPISPRR